MVQTADLYTVRYSNMFSVLPLYFLCFIKQNLLDSFVSSSSVLVSPLHSAFIIYSVMAQAI